MSSSVIRIADAHSHVGERVTVQGWLYNLRKSGKIVFPVMRDGTGLMQCVAVKSNLPESVFESLKNLTQESSLTISGTIYLRGTVMYCKEQDEKTHVISDTPFYYRIGIKFIFASRAEEAEVTKYCEDTLRNLYNPAA